MKDGREPLRVEEPLERGILKKVTCRIDRHLGEGSGESRSPVL